MRPNGPAMLLGELVSALDTIEPDRAGAVIVALFGDDGRCDNFMLASGALMTAYGAESIGFHDDHRLLRKAQYDDLREWRRLYGR